MRAVWSFWSKPFVLRGHEVWLSEQHHLFSWALSVMTARRHYRTTAHGRTHALAWQVEPPVDTGNQLSSDAALPVNPAAANLVTAIAALPISAA
jgi:hypothetical protein